MLAFRIRIRPREHGELMGILGNRLNIDELQVDQSGLLNQLPFKYQAFRITEDRRPIGFRFYSNSATIEALVDGKAIVVCGEAFDAPTATAKAFSELIERSTLLKYAASNPQVNRTSNGWAAHFEEVQAELNATLEIVERDAVLAQWYSASPFLEIENSALPNSILNWMNVELSRSEFPNMRVLISTEGIGPSVTCILVNSNGFGVCGHSSKSDLASAIENAIGEACRAAHLSLRNAHYADTEVLRTKEFGVNVNPGAHAVYYAYQEPFPDWMFGEKVSWFNALRLWNFKMTLLNKEHDLFKIQTVLTDPLYVSFAQHPNAFELSWGPTSADKIRNAKTSHRLVETKINLKPHPIS